MKALPGDRVLPAVPIQPDLQKPQGWRSTTSQHREPLARIPSLLAELPSELQTLVLCKLTWQDILRCRSTCRFFFNLVQNHAREIGRNLFKQDTDLRRAHSLYRNVYDSTPSLDYVMALSNRCYLAESVARFLATYHLMEIFYCRTPAHLAQSKYAPLVDTIIANLKPHIMIISHMLRTYRSSVAELVKHMDLLSYEGGLVSKTRIQSWRKEVEILDGYNQWEVCNTSLVFELVKKTLFRQLRPVSYATSLERRLRGWTKPSATDQQVMKLVVFGGLDAIKRIMVIQSYNMRIKALDQWLEFLTATEPPNNSHVVGDRTDTLPIYRSFYYSFDSTTTARIMKILPDRVCFFNVWELAKLTGSRIGTLERYRNRMGLVEFLVLLREDIDSDFELRRREETR
ncbi:MAG: hypothetical protein L6R39_005214 [Caloplaca ligustica]|nr:MAG: hypothetical protein L6R39_005214 [Caloplaca ligustica]